MSKFFTFILLLISIRAFPQNISGVVNLYRKVLWADSSKGAVKLSDVTGFGSFNGRKAMVIQMKGATIDETQSASFGNITAINNTGNYDIGTICGFLNDTMVFERKFHNFYDVSGIVQCVIFPQLTGDATVTDTLKAGAWDPVTGTGGILALDVPGILYLNKPASADGMGFKGGGLNNYTSDCSDFNFPPLNIYQCTEFYLDNPSPSIYKSGGKKGEGIADYIAAKYYAKGKQASGGGGGNNSNNGGGGGSNYAAGGQGGNKTSGSCTNSNPGVGGTALSAVGYSAVKNKIFLGGGGGAGHQDNDVGTPGGNGGGIVYIACNSLQSSNEKITANGGRPYRASLTDPYASYSDGGGGGGGAGVIILNTASVTGNLQVEAKGANGSNTESNGNPQCSGPGGGGGAGAIWLSMASVPGNINAVLSGGAAGIIQASSSACVGSSNGATAGSGGAVVFNFALPVPADSSIICKDILPLDLFVSLNGYARQQQRFITATASPATEVQQCILQKTNTGGNFYDHLSQQNNHTTQYNFIDNDKTAPIYRAKLITYAGQTIYSPVLHFAGKTDKNISINIFPNPVKQKATLQVYSAKTSNGTLSITDAAGKLVWQQDELFSKGFNDKFLLTDKMPIGILFIKVLIGGETTVKTFVNSAH